MISGKWTDAEHLKWIEGCLTYGNEWRQVQEYVPTRSLQQIRSHSQKFLNKNLKKYLEEDKAFRSLIAKVKSQSSQSLSQQIVLSEELKNKRQILIENFSSQSLEELEKFVLILYSSNNKKKYECLNDEYAFSNSKIQKNKDNCDECKTNYSLIRVLLKTIISQQKLLKDFNLNFDDIFPEDFVNELTAKFKLQSVNIVNNNNNNLNNNNNNIISNGQCNTSLNNSTTNTTNYLLSKENTANNFDSEKAQILDILEDNECKDSFDQLFSEKHRNYFTNDLLGGSKCMPIPNDYHCEFESEFWDNN
jgi:hypothetical protein